MVQALRWDRVVLAVVDHTAHPRRLELRPGFPHCRSDAVAGSHHQMYLTLVRAVA